MFTIEQYRASAAEYSEKAKMANDTDEAFELQKLERSFTELAENAQWVADHQDQTVHAAGHAEEATLAVVELSQPREPSGSSPDRSTPSVAASDPQS